ncbi:MULTISPECIES: ion transporter [unclassified Methanoculleus]|uniref:ion transporter n=1 Tax=unclassified Methanoculleus TaxID=2619537 RepID=UPI0025F56F7D|nr:MULTISPECIES: ion transporter [unclassified Methanoculleus]
MQQAAGKTRQERKADLRDLVYRILSDGLMIFLGLVMAPIVIIPLLVPTLPQPVVEFLNMADTTIIAIFVLEYVLKLALAEDPVSHFLDRWHLLDLAIITLPALEVVPVAGSTLARSSPTLRLLRVPGRPEEGAAFRFTLKKADHGRMRYPGPGDRERLR